MQRLDIPPLGLSRGFTYRTLVGLPLLWAASYFVPALTPTGAYLLPSDHALGLVLVPTLVLVGGGAAALSCLGMARRWIAPQVATCGAAVGIAVLSTIAVKVLIKAAGHDWEYLVPLGGNYPLKLYSCKYGVSLGFAALVWSTRRALGRWTRTLSSLGLALGVFAIIRLCTLWYGAPDIAAWAPGNTPAVGIFARTGTASASSNLIPPAAAARSRRVVWVLFDETDYTQLQAAMKHGLQNFARLEQVAVSATSANSPASATLYSVPALLTGVSPGGKGVRIDAKGSLSIERPDDTSVPFSEATSIFGALAAQGRSASVLGFYQPYCKLFKLARCDSFSWPFFGGLGAAFWTNVPDSLITRTAYSDYLTGIRFGQITATLVRLMPDYLMRDDALTFLHLNIPHPPATYADKELHLHESPDPVIEYGRNLLVTDRILGEIVNTVQLESARHEILLIVSTDHWLRKKSYGEPGPDVSQPIPLMIWKVGATEGITVPQPVSTVHISAMILDYLDGRIGTQPEIAHWWSGRPSFPSFIAPSG